MPASFAYACTSDVRVDGPFVIIDGIPANGVIAVSEAACFRKFLQLRDIEIICPAKNTSYNPARGNLHTACP
jgi:hypothetical protein